MSSKRYSATALIASALASAALFYFSLAKPSAAEGLKHPEVVALEARRIQSVEMETLFGNGWRMSSKLGFLGAHELKRTNPQFGGWSGLTFDARDKRFIAVSDTGHWMSFGRFAQDQDSLPQEKVAATLGPVLDADGNPVAGNGARDIEAIALAGTETYLSYESPTSGLYYADRRGTEKGRFQRMHHLSSEFSALPKGYGLEALTRISPEEAPLELLAIAERPLERQTDIPAWLIKSPHTQAEITRLKLPDQDGYDISEIAWSPSCGLFGIQRKLTWYGRLKIKLVKLSISADHSSIATEELFYGHSGGTTIDNYEGLAIVDIAPGVCDLYAISDDNFLPIQKTILMRLRYKEDA